MKLSALIAFFTGLGALVASTYFPYPESPFSTLRASAVHLNVGSGAIILSPSGRKYVLTNWHVCTHAEVSGRVSVLMPNGSVVITKIAKQSSIYDLCAISIPSDSTAIRIADKFHPGEQTWTRGWPNGVLSESAGRSGKKIDMVVMVLKTGDSCLYGWTEAALPEVGAVCFIHYVNYAISNYVYYGSSGSAVTNQNGELVGVVQTYSPEHGGGMRPLSAVKDFLKDL